jgi:type II secretory pathway pseudopilin PulG
MAGPLLIDRIMYFDVAARQPDISSCRSSCARRTGEQGFSLIDILMVVALIGVIAGIAVPVTGGAFASQKFRNDGQALTGLIGVAKMRASAGFTRARLRANLTDRTFVLERWNKTANVWSAEETVALSFGVTFSFGAVADPPPGTQVTIGFSPACRIGLTTATAAIANSHCIVFNSRGLPVDGDGVSFGGHALYLTDGVSVAGATVTATPRIRRWSTPAQLATPQWREQQ